MNRAEVINFLIRDSIENYFVGSNTNLDERIYSLMYPKDLSQEDMIDIMQEIDDRKNDILVYLNSIPYNKTSYELIRSKWIEAIVESKKESFSVNIEGNVYELTFGEGKWILESIRELKVIDGTVISGAIYDGIKSRNPELYERDVAIRAMNEFAQRRDDLRKPFADAISVLQKHKLELEQTQKEFGTNDNCSDEIKAVDTALSILYNKKQGNNSEYPDLPF